MLIGGPELCCTCFGGGAGICVLLCEHQPATGASSARHGPPCCSGCAAPSPMWDLVADGALLERPAADVRAVALVALRGHAAGHTGGGGRRAAGRGVDPLGPSSELRGYLRPDLGARARAVRDWAMVAW